MKAVGVIWPRCICRSIKESRNPSPFFLLKSFGIGSEESMELHDVQCFSLEASPDQNCVKLQQKKSKVRM